MYPLVDVFSSGCVWIIRPFCLSAVLILLFLRDDTLKKVRKPPRDSLAMIWSLWLLLLSVLSRMLVLDAAPIVYVGFVLDVGFVIYIFGIV